MWPDGWPEQCPHRSVGVFCRIDDATCTASLYHRRCPADLGDWGAWRSVAGIVAARFADLDPRLYRVGVWTPVEKVAALLRAAGWSP
jgi:hypothetical protein